MIRIITSLLLVLQGILLSGQSEQFDYLKIGLTSEANPMAEAMKGNYEKEFYYNQSFTVFLKRLNDNLELQFYDSSKNLSRIYLRVNNQVYVWEQPVLVDERYDELSAEEKKEFPKFYTIGKADIKVIE